MSEAPKIIYLQWSDHPLAEVTWCIDQAAQDEDADVEYVRKDIVDDLLAANEKALEFIDKACARSFDVYIYISDEKIANETRKVIEAAIAAAESKP